MFLISFFAHASWQKGILDTEEYRFRMHEAMEIMALCIYGEPVFVCVGPGRQTSCSQALDVHLLLACHIPDIPSGVKHL